MIEYDLKRLFEHPLKFRQHFAPTIVTFSEGHETACQIAVRWKSHRDSEERQDIVSLTWSLDELRAELGNIEDEIRILRELDEDQARRTEYAAVVVAVAVMSHIEPETRFIRRSDTGTRHDYYFNETRDEMIEVAGRWEGGLPSLFEEKRQQSDLNPNLKKRWVSVTIVSKKPRNQTEGLHHADKESGGVSGS